MVFPIRRWRPFKRPKLPKRLSRYDWLEVAILTVKCVRDAGSLAPVPYLEKSAEVVLRILEGIKQAESNGKDFEKLVKDIVDMVDIISKEAALAQHPQPEDSPFNQSCRALAEDLTELEEELAQIREENQSRIRWFIFASKFQKDIEGQRSQLRDIKVNFQTAMLSDMRQMQAYMQRHFLVKVETKWQAPHGQFRLVNATNEHFVLPVHLYPTYQDFESILHPLLRNWVGREFVERGAYELVRANETTSIDPSSWREKLTDGCTIWMNIVVKQSEMDQRDDSRQCPKCGFLCVYGALGSEVTCSSCQAIFRVSEAFVDVVDGDAPDSSPEEGHDDSARDSIPTTPNNARQASLAKASTSRRRLNLQYFSRIHVFLDTIIKAGQSSLPSLSSPVSAVPHQGPSTPPIEHFVHQTSRVDVTKTFLRMSKICRMRGFENV
ncbi:hypothetical protein K438DRAFT_1865879 [Mycena galopus ATCC 62051]|nr:hypothetical protein K438DRAFT_1865879 [Mycena galopus ATCC 62051]